MWTEITNDEELTDFLNSIYYFHDSCIKEMKYYSGAYVCDDLGMYPTNNRRVLKVVIQRQFGDIPTMEMEFSGLRFLRLSPSNEKYTCEILDATMVIKDGCIYWCDCGGITDSEFDDYEGTIICAEKFRWRPIENGLGPNEYYRSES